ncbi:MAG: superinfection immunity protein [Pseudomonadota bacterium]
MNGLNWIACLWLSVSLVYLLPTFIAAYRHANSLWAIAVLNLLFGWTLVMWFGASVWAITDKTHSR